MNPSSPKSVEGTPWGKPERVAIDNIFHKYFFHEFSDQRATWQESVFLLHALFFMFIVPILNPFH